MINIPVSLDLGTYILRSMKIQKSSGEFEQFNKAKYQRSLKAIGLSKKEAEDIARNVGRSLKDGVSTEKLAKKNSNSFGQKRRSCCSQI